MKTVLIVPDNYIISEDKLNKYQWNNMWEFKSRKRLWSSPSLSLLTVAGMFPSYFTIDYIDLNYTEEIINDYDVAFFSPSTSQINQAFAIADSLRNKGTIVIMGGVHVSMLPDEASEHADSVVIGECEETFSELLQDLENGALKKIYKSNSFCSLEKSPIPLYHLIKDYKYMSIPIQTSRGCPHQCSFCVSSKLYGKKYRRKSFEQVKNEIDVIHEIWPKPFLFFTDDNIFLDKSFSERLINYLAEKRARWYAFSDARIAYKPDLLEKIANSGCSQLLIGFESLSSKNLAQINQNKFKKGKRENYKQIVETIQSLGIAVVGSFVLGLDEDTEEVFTELYGFIENTNLYATNVTVVTPFPGTALYQKLKDENRLIESDWSKYNGFELTFKTKRITHENFEEGLVWLYKKLDSAKRIVKVLNYFKSVIKQKKGYCQ